MLELARERNEPGELFGCEIRRLKEIERKEMQKLREQFERAQYTERIEQCTAQAVLAALAARDGQQRYRVAGEQ